MVYHDLSDVNSDFKETSKSSMAPIQDRMLSVLVDFVLFWPLFTLVLAGILKQLQLRYYLAPDSAEFYLLLFVTVSGYLLMSILSQALFWSVLGATPGQIFFQIRIASAQSGKNPTLGMAVVRSVLFFLSFIVFGFPFLEVFSHESRRAWYDRAADTQVLTKKKIGLAKPIFEEVRVVRALYALALSISLVFISSTMQSFYVRAMNSEGRQAELLQQGSLCQEVVDNSSHGRIDAALAQYLVGDLSGECLSSEVDFAFWKGSASEQAWASVAMANMKKKDRALQKKYFNQACHEEASGEACQIAVWQMSAKHLSQMPSSLQESWTAAVLFLTELRDFSDHQAWEQALDTFPAKESLSDFFQTEKIKSLSAQNFDEKTQGAYSVVWSQLGERAQKNLAADLCLQEISKDCSNRPYSYCHDLNLAFKSNSEAEVQENWVMAMLEDRSCRGLSDPKLISFMIESGADSDLAKLISALVPNEKTSSEKAQGLLREVAFKKQERGFLQSRALFHLLRTSDQLNDFIQARAILDQTQDPYQAGLIALTNEKMAKLFPDQNSTSESRLPASQGSEK